MQLPPCGTQEASRSRNLTPLVARAVVRIGAAAFAPRAPDRDEGAARTPRVEWYNGFMAIADQPGRGVELVACSVAAALLAAASMDAAHLVRTPGSRR